MSISDLPDRTGVYLYSPTARIRSGSFVKHLQIMLVILANGAN